MIPAVEIGRQIRCDMKNIKPVKRWPMNGVVGLQFRDPHGVNWEIVSERADDSKCKLGDWVSPRRRVFNTIKIDGSDCSFILIGPSKINGSMANLHKSHPDCLFWNGMNNYPGAVERISGNKMIEKFNYVRPF